VTTADNIADLIEKDLPADLLAFSRSVGEIARRRKNRATLVGGAVRDLLIGWPVVDADFMLEPPAAPVATELAKKVGVKLTSHERFQTFSLTLPPNRKIDLVTAREETYATPAALPQVKPTTLEKDLRRRDFTINAIASRLDDDFGALIDPFGGRTDMAGKVIRALHDKSFVDDPTRIFRAARFAGRLGFRVEPKTRGWIQAAIDANVPAKLSPMRRRHEFEMMLKENKPTAALQMLRDWDALRFVHPDWANADVRAMGLDDVLAMDETMSLLEARLARWLRWWGPARAQEMMTELTFERSVKRAVTDALHGH
jgi:tRNA nucleotidyltransferase (CCA-adding enzyme)